MDSLTSHASAEILLMGAILVIFIYALIQSAEPEKSEEDWCRAKEKWREDRLAFFAQRKQLQALDTNEIDWSKFSLLLTWEFARERDLWIIPKDWNDLDLTAGYFGYETMTLIAPEPTTQDLSQFLSANSSNLELFASVMPKDFEYNFGSLGYIYEIEQFMELYSAWEDRSARPILCFSPGHLFPRYPPEFCKH